jgi:signal transduction histidine kinase
MTEPALAGRRLRRHARAGAAAGRLPWSPALIAVLPTATVTLLGAALAGFLLTGSPSPAAASLALLTAAVGALAVLAVAARTAAAFTGRLRQQLMALREEAASGQVDMQELAERLQRGERPELPGPAEAPAGTTDPFSLLAYDLRRQRHAARLLMAQAVASAVAAQAVASAAATRPDYRVELLVNLARRMQSLLYREIQLLDGLESRVEDPELLKGLFGIDALATQMRRQTESLAVVGGAVARRQWSRCVPVHEVLRAAIAEVEHYNRVKIVPPVPGTLEPAAVADVIHLLAELIENAAKFSRPEARTLLRAEMVTAGLVIEVEDRGLGIQPQQRRELNRLLARPGYGSAGERLGDGRIGLVVVSALARRHGIRVELHSNVFGGTQAVAVLPSSLADAGPRPDEHIPARAAPAVTGSPAAVKADMSLTGAAPAGERPALPSRRAASAPANGAGTASVPRPPALTTDGPCHQPDGRDERPPLPARSAESYMAPQLRAKAAVGQDDASDHRPGLMAAFRTGVRRAGGGDNAPDRAAPPSDSREEQP